MEIIINPLKGLRNDLIVPATLDLDELQSKFPLPQRGVTRDSLLYIVNLIYRNSLQYKEDFFIHKKNGFIPLHAKFLKNVLSTYIAVVKYLIKAGVIECDNNYKVDVYSKGYRMSDQYDTIDYKKEKFRKDKMYYKLAEIYRPSNELQEYWKEKRFYLYKPFGNGSLTIDFDSASKELDYLEQQKLQLAELEGSNDINRRLKFIARAYRKQKTVIKMIMENDYSVFPIITDATSFRFHTPITRLHKDIRKHLKIDGERAIAIDLKNSQPYFFLLFFTREFWEAENEKKGQICLNNINSKYRDNIINNDDNNNNNNVYSYMIPIPTSPHTNSQTPIKLFCHLIRKAKLYEYFVENYAQKTKYFSKFPYQEQRRRMKKKMIMLLYDANRTKRKATGFTKFFIDNFQPIYNFLTLLKSYSSGINKRVKDGFEKKYGEKEQPTEIRYKEVDSGFSELSIILQKIESYCFLDIICKRINQRFPDLNFLTIHDSIIVPQSAAHYMQMYAREILWDLTGTDPEFELDNN